MEEKLKLCNITFSGAITVNGPMFDIHDNGTVINRFVADTAQREAEELPTTFTDEQVKASGIKVQPKVVLEMMRRMSGRCEQKVDWMSFYCVLLRRRWVESNIRGWCRMIEELFDVAMDSRTMAKDLSNQGGPDYTEWTEADRRIVRRKQLATDFDRELTEYLERGRKAVLEGLK